MNEALFEAAQTDSDLKKQIAETATRTIAQTENPAQQLFAQDANQTASMPGILTPAFADTVPGGEAIQNMTKALLESPGNPLLAGAKFLANDTLNQAYQLIRKELGDVVEPSEPGMEEAGIYDRALFLAHSMSASKAADKGKISKDAVAHKLKQSLKSAGVELFYLPDEQKLGYEPVLLFFKEMEGEDGKKKPHPFAPSQVLSKTELEALKRAKNTAQRYYMLQKFAKKYGYEAQFVRGIDPETGTVIPYDEEGSKELAEASNPILYNPRRNTAKILSQDKLQDTAGALLLNWAVMAGSFGGATLGGAAASTVTANPVAGLEGGALGATAGASAMAPIQGELNDILFGTHLAPESIDEASELVGKTWKENFWADQALLVGAPLAVGGALKVAKGAAKLAKATYEVGKTAVGAGSYAPKSIWSKATKLIKQSGVREEEINKAVTNLEKIANLPGKEDKELRQVIGSLAVDNPTLNRNARELLSKDPIAAERLSKIAKSVEDTLTKVFEKGKVKDVDVQALKQSLNFYENNVKTLYQNGLQKIKVLTKGQKFVVNRPIKEAALDIQKAIGGIKDEAIVSKLRALNNRLLRWDKVNRKWVPKPITSEELVEVNKMLNELAPTIKTYVGEKTIRSLQKGFRQMLTAANPEAGKIYQTINARYAKMMNFKESDIGKKILQKPYNLAKQDEFFRDMALTMEKNAPQAAQVLDRLKPAERAAAETKLLKSLVETSRGKVEYMKHPYIDFEALAKKLDAIAPYKKQVFRANPQAFENLKAIVDTVKPFSSYMKMANRTASLGGKLASETNSWLSWKWVRAMRSLSNAVMQFIFKDTAYQRTLSHALSKTSPRNPEQVLKILEKSLPKQKSASFANEFIKVRSAIQKIREGKPLSPFESYAMFGVPYGVEVKTDENGKITGLELHADRAIAGTVAGFFVGKASRSLMRQVREMQKTGKSAREIYRELGVYQGRDGKWRMVLSGDDYELDIKKFKKAADKANKLVTKQMETSQEFFDAAMSYGARNPQEALELAQEFPELRKYLKKLDSLQSQIEKTITFRLGDIVTNPNAKIFKKFPKLKDFTVRIEPDEPGNAGYHAGTTISINPNTMVKYGEEKVKETFVHETQHGIQSLSGFSQGGGIENAIWASVRKEFPEAGKIMEKIANARTEASKDKWYTALGKYMASKGYPSPDDWFQTNPQKVQDAYLKMYGEAEARMAATTRKMTDKDILKMRIEGILPDDIIYSKNRLKSWKDLTIVDEKNPFKFRDAISFNIVARSGSTDPSHYVALKLVGQDPIYIKRVEEQLSKTKEGRRALEKAKKYGIKPLLAYMTDEELQHITSQTVTNLYKQLKSGKGFYKVNELEAAAKAGAANKEWYGKQTLGLQYLFGEEEYRLFEMFAKEAGALSGQNEVGRNTFDAVQFWYNWTKLGKPLDDKVVFKLLNDAGAMASRQDAKRIVQYIKEGVKYGKSLKVPNFTNNLLGDQTKFTNDTHVGRMKGMNEADAGKTRNLADTLMARIVADKLTQKSGMLWSTADVQAAAWVYSKSVSDLLKKNPKLLNKLISNKEYGKIVQYMDKEGEGFIDNIIRNKTLQKLLKATGVKDENIRKAGDVVARLNARGVEAKRRLPLTDADRKALDKVTKRIVSTNKRVGKEAEKVRAKWYIEPNKSPVHRFFVNPSAAEKTREVAYVGGKPVRLLENDAVINLTPVGGITNEEFIRHSQRYVNELKRLARKHGVKIKGGVAQADGLFEGTAEKSLQFVVRGDEQNVKRFVSEYGKKYGQWSVHIGKLGKSPLSVDIKVPKGANKKIHELLKKHGFAGATYDNGVLRLDFIKEYSPNYKNPAQVKKEYKQFLSEAKALAAEMGAKAELKNIEVTPIFNKKFVTDKNLEIYDKYIKLHPATLGAMLGFEVYQDKDGKYHFSYDPVKGALGAIGGALYASAGGRLTLKEFKALMGWLKQQGRLHLTNTHKLVTDIKMVKYYQAAAQTARNAQGENE